MPKRSSCAIIRATPQWCGGTDMSTQLAFDYTTAPSSGLRPLEPRRDLGQVADLIEEAFGGELESGGLAALRDMRMLSRMGPLVSLMARSDPYLEDVLGGFVWIEEDRVVGNVTIQRLDPYGSRWQIANVAVTKAYQGRGIGRALVEAAVQRIDDRRGGWAVLQVRTDNALALGLYKRLGFEPVTEEAVLTMEGLPESVEPEAPPAGLRPFHHDEWQARYVLEAASRTDLAKWWRPVRSHQFMQTFESRLGEKLRDVVGSSQTRRWVVEAGNGFSAFVAVNARRWQGVHRLEFTVHPACRGELEGPLIGHAFQHLLEFPRWPIRVEHPGEHREMIDALQQAGFRLVRNHLSMRQKLNA